MASTDTDICNMALQFIGFAANFITSLDEDSEEARTCKFWYERRRDLLLEAWPFEMAKKYADLNEVAEDPNPDWKFSYRMPSDCIFAMRVLKGGSNTRYPENADPVPYTTAQDAQGWLILTDQSPACLKYTGRLENTAYWRETFYNALGWSIASVIALPLGRDVAFQNNAVQQLSDAIATAESVSANEPTDDEEMEATGIRDRNGITGLRSERPIAG
jgi:hypothetical protein